MGKSVSEETLLDRARQTVQGMMSEREATADLSSDEVARYLQYVSHFKSIGYALRMAYYGETIVHQAEQILTALSYRKQLLNLPVIGNPRRWELTALKEVKALTIQFDYNLAPTAGTKEFSKMLELDRRLLASLREAVGDWWITKVLPNSAGIKAGDYELVGMLENQLYSYENLHEAIGQRQRAKWGVILSFMQDVVDSIQI